MTSKYLAGILILALGFALCVPAAAQNPQIAGSSGSKAIVSSKAIVGGIVGAVAVVVVVTILAIHYSKKRTITGCVSSGANGLNVTDEGDKRIYLLAGNTVGITPGDRVKLHGRKEKSNGPDKTLAWDTEKVIKDFGVCQNKGGS